MEYASNGKGNLAVTLGTVSAYLTEAAITILTVAVTSLRTSLNTFRQSLLRTQRSHC